MKNKMRFTLALTLVFLLLTASFVFAVDMTASSWTESGPGVTSIIQYNYDTLRFDYNLTPSGYSPQTWTLKSIADSDETFTFHWAHYFHHCWFQANAKVVAYAKQPGGGEQTKTLHNSWSGPTTKTGSSTLDVKNGYEYGFRIYGDHYDSSNTLKGYFIVAEGVDSAPILDVDSSPYSEGEWTNQDVDIEFTATDNHLSSLKVGVDSQNFVEHYTGGAEATGSRTITSSGSYVVNAIAKDLFLNETTRDFMVNVDKTKPWISINSVDVFDGDTKDLGYIATGYDKPYTFKDDLSGYVPTGELDKPLTLDVLADNPGFNQTYDLDIIDRAENEATITFEYHVLSIDDLMDLLEPMEIGGTYQRNRTIPIKLQILDDQGDPVEMSADDLTFVLRIIDEDVVRTNSVPEELGEFEFDLSEDGLTYQFNLKTKGFELGSHTLEIFIEGKEYTDEGLVGIVNFEIVGKDK